MRRILLVLCGCLCLTSLAATAGEKSRGPKVSTTSATKESRKRPNVIILLADDLGSKDLGCYGGPVKDTGAGRAWQRERSAVHRLSRRCGGLLTFARNPPDR